MYLRRTNMEKYGNRVSGQDACSRRDGSSTGNSIAVGSYQFAQRQVGFPSGRAGRTITKKLEKPALRKDGGGRTINTNKQAVSAYFYDRYGKQAQQNDSSQSLEPRLTRGEL
jgi:hypothetical protein